MLNFLKENQTPEKDFISLIQFNLHKMFRPSFRDKTVFNLKIR